MKYPPSHRAHWWMYFLTLPFIALIALLGALALEVLR